MWAFLLQTSWTLLCSAAAAEAGDGAPARPIVSLSGNDSAIRFKSYYLIGSGQEAQAHGFFVIPRSEKPILLEEYLQQEIGKPPVWKERARIDPKVPRPHGDLEVILDEPGGINVWLQGGILEKQVRLDSDEGIFRAEGLEPGEYVVKLDPDYEDWGSHCVGHARVRIEGARTRIRMEVPAASLEVVGTFQGRPAPSHREGLAVARVERMEEGKVDPIYRQWLFIHPTGETETWEGRLGYLAAGRYRFTFFTTTDSGKQEVERTRDVCFQEVEIGVKALSDGVIHLRF